MNNPQLDPQAAHRTATIIGLSLALGVSFFAGAAWWSERTRTIPREFEPTFTLPLVFAWIGLTIFTTIGARLVWRNRVDPLIHSQESLPRARMPELTASLLICWALVESAALFGVTIYFLTGAIWVAGVSVILIWIAIIATLPQAEWYERFR